MCRGGSGLMQDTIQTGRTNRTGGPPSGSSAGRTIRDGLLKAGRTPSARAQMSVQAAKVQDAKTTTRITRRLPRLQTILSQALFIIFLIMFCLSFQRDLSVPAFTGGEPESTTGRCSPLLCWTSCGNAVAFPKCSSRPGFPC